MLGRLNAALNQSGTLDKSIEDVLEHFVYVPKHSPVNPQDIPFFLSTRLATDEKKEAMMLGGSNDTDDILLEQNPMATLQAYEKRAAELAQEYEEHMVRF